VPSHTQVMKAGWLMLRRGLDFADEGWQGYCHTLMPLPLSKAASPFNADGFALSPYVPRGHTAALGLSDRQHRSGPPTVRPGKHKPASRMPSPNYQLYCGMPALSPKAAAKTGTSMRTAPLELLLDFFSRCGETSLPKDVCDRHHITSN
jgi:hypothetical protein